MARRKNVKRIDPRYFLHETVNRNDDGSTLEEQPLRRGPEHPSKWSRRVQGWVARKNQELGSLDAVLAAATESEPEVLAAIQAEVDRLRTGGEALEEDVFSAIGDMVSRTGLAGGKAKKNVFWRKKGKSRYEKKIDEYFPAATNSDFRSFFEDGDKYDASYKGLGRAWDDYLRTVVKSKQRSAKKKNDAYERNKQRERDAEESAKQQARKDREEAEREAYRKSPEGRRKAAWDAEIQAARDKKSRNKAAAAARRERERESGGDGSWSDVFDFSHQLEEQILPRRKNVKRIDPRYFLNETVNRLDEREGETAEDVAARLKNMPASFRGSAVNDFLNMRDGSTEMARHYPHVQDLAAFASDVLELLGES